ncbi:MAG: 2-C-methyl-D-erythritol 4-phosphate cytidylyltransferase [Burkholderiaceae bacterium]|nr:2-C-methyl-D-erythritol 4-phosphate cytidylyltransferase [Burkholderiaceae bacterium]
MPASTSGNRNFLLHQPMSQPRYFALIPAAGVGTRLGAEVPKQYLPLAGKLMLRHAAQAFLSCAAVAHTFIVVSEGDGWIDSAFPAGTAGVTLLRCGGATRRDSVLNGLQAMRQADVTVRDDDWVLVHDAARPGITPQLIDKLMAEVGDDAVGGLLALPVVDTVKRVADGKVTTVPRDGLWLAQTPQMFRHALLLRALRQNANVTDEASAIEVLGLSPKLVEGHQRNSKVTLAADIALAELFLSQHT